MEREYFNEWFERGEDKQDLTESIKEQEPSDCGWSKLTNKTPKHSWRPSFIPDTTHPEYREWALSEATVATNSGGVQLTTIANVTGPEIGLMESGSASSLTQDVEQLTNIVNELTCKLSELQQQIDDFQSRERKTTQLYARNSSRQLGGSIDNGVQGLTRSNTDEDNVFKAPTPTYDQASSPWVLYMRDMANALRSEKNSNEERESLMDQLVKMSSSQYEKLSTPTNFEIRFVDKNQSDFDRAMEIVGE